MKKVSLNDLAKSLGVSKTLVSLVLNGKGTQYGINKDVQERVKAKAVELNYRPNQTARSLRSGKTQNIGLVTSSLSNPFQAHIADRLEKELAKNGYNLIISSTEVGKNNLASLSRNVDGLIINSAIQSGVIKQLIGNEFPVVMLNTLPSEFVANYVGLDFANIVGISAEHLLQKGHQQLALILSKDQNPQEVQRLIQGAQDALEKNGLSKDNLVLVNLDLNKAGSVEKAMDALAKHDPRATGLLCANNMLTLQVFEALSKLGYKIPEDFSIISLLDHDVFNFTYPKISATKTPYDELVSYTVDFLLKQIDGKMVSVQNIEVGGALEFRGSC